MSNTAAAAYRSLWRELARLREYPWTHAYGAGCSGGGLQPALRAITAPAIGTTFTMRVTGLNATAQATFGAVGFGDEQWLGTPLPWDLGTLGMTGCTLLLAPEITHFLVRTNQWRPGTRRCRTTRACWGSASSRRASRWCQTPIPPGLSPPKPWTQIVPPSSGGVGVQWERPMADSLPNPMFVRFVPALLAGVAAVLLLGTGFLAWSIETKEVVRERVRARLASIEAKEQPWPGRRAALWGETTPGLAFDHYAAAAARIGWFPVWWDGTRRQVVEKQQVASAARVAELRSAWAPALRRLQIGAHCGDAQQPAAGRWALGHLHQPIQVEVGALLAEGRAPLAVRLWLDGLTFAVDQLAPMAWAEQGVRRMLEIGSPEVLATLADPELELLAQGLARLDPLLAHWPDYEVAILRRGRGLLERTDDGLHLGYDLCAWQSGFDLETQQLETLEELLDLRRFLYPVAGDGAARQAQWQAWSAEPRIQANWYGRWLEPLLDAAERQQRHVLTQLRLLRLAVAFHRREPLLLADPFAAGPLQVHLDGDCAVFRSAESFWGQERRATRR